MVSVQGNSKTNSVDESKLSITSFHQCRSLVSIKLSTTNFLLWKSQIILPLIRSLNVEPHITSFEISPDEVTDSAGEKKSLLVT